ncbi:hypothetical protein ACT80S_14745 [Ramlibacter sp. MAHUQ-53]|uniref:hypothetical protein n=1 Tax=unclassified Ramlibacter TaxID=2617605 RepID=UPI00362EF729
MTKQRLALGRILKDSIRLYFAPLTGAWRGIRMEIDRIEREIEARRRAEREACPPEGRRPA